MFSQRVQSNNHMKPFGAGSMYPYPLSRFIVYLLTLISVRAVLSGEHPEAMQTGTAPFSRGNPPWRMLMSGLASALVSWILLVRWQIKNGCIVVPSPQAWATGQSVRRRCQSNRLSLHHSSSVRQQHKHRNTPVTVVLDNNTCPLECRCCRR